MEAEVEVEAETEVEVEAEAKTDNAVETELGVVETEITGSSRTTLSSVPTT